MTHYKSISFKASTLQILDRTPQGKTIGIRSQSMLPQLHVTPSFLNALVQVQTRKAGISPCYKLSSTHFLSLLCEDCYWSEVQFPSADMIIHLRATSRQKIVDHLVHDEKVLETVFQALDRISYYHQTLEALDFCKVILLYSKDKYLGRLLLRFEVLFPHCNLLFTPLGPHKLVSCPLTKKLVQKSEAFDRGYLTLDQSSRLVPLEPSDPMVLKYPIIGIWVKGIPQTNSASKTIQIVHPLVWAACMQFILNKDFREKASPCPSTCAFLLIDFSEKLKIYEVTCQKTPAWKTTSYAAEVETSENSLKVPLNVQFLKSDTRFLLKSIVGNYPVQSTSNSRSGTPPSSKPRGIKILRNSASAKDNLRKRSYDKIIDEQTKLIEKLQVKVQNLQAQVSPKSKSLNDLNGKMAALQVDGRLVDGIEKVKKKIDFDLDEMGQGPRNLVYCSQRVAKPMVGERVRIVQIHRKGK